MVFIIRIQKKLSISNVRPNLAKNLYIPLKVVNFFKFLAKYFAVIDLLHKN